MDVSSSHPNFEAINYLYDNGVIEGYSDNTFRPAEAVNRAEALKILLLGSDIFVPNLQPQEVFPDVMHDAWYGKYVNKAKNLGVVKGDDGTGMFRPGDTVNLAEALKMLLKTNNTDSPTPSSNPYWDVSANDWFAPYFEYARLGGLLDKSSNENVYPSTPVTRALLAELMYRLSTSNVVIADGKSSYYGEKFHGKTTASGAIFDASAYTAAHLTYSFGTRLKVTSVETGKSVVVEVNDRGPYVSDPNRILDLSKAAFEYISPLSRGIIEVRIEETNEPITTTPKSSLSDLVNGGFLNGDLLNNTRTSCPDIDTLKYVTTNTYTGITLDEEIPTRMLLDEVLTLSGTTSSTSTVSAFIVDEENNQTAFSGNVEGGRFVMNVRFPKEGAFRLGILPGESGQSAIKEIKVQKNTCIEEVDSNSLDPLSNLVLDTENGDMTIQWDKNGYDLFKVTFSQGGLHKSYILHGLDEWTPIYKEFTTFQKGDVSLSVRGAHLFEKSILEPAQIIWGPSVQKSFLADQHYEYNVNSSEVTLNSLSKDSILGETIQASFKAKSSIRAKAAVILPTGKVAEIDLQSSSAPSTNQFDVDVFSSSNNTITASYKATVTGIHFLEINNSEGLAAINVPIYVRNQFPLLPSPRDLSDQTSVDLGGSLAALRSQFLNLVNQDRGKHGLSTIKLDPTLNNLAQFKSDDMVSNDYFSHWNKDGMTSNDLRLNYGIQTTVSENLAKDVTLELAEYGLMRSAIHRSNILSDEWTRIGFGITQSGDGSYVFVQIFSTDPLDMNDLSGLKNSVLTTINDSRSANLAQQSNLNTLAQSWSLKMADEDFFDFTDGSGDTLVDSIRDAGVTASLGTYIMGNNSFSDLLDQVSGNVQVQDIKWKNLGIGIEQDSLGIIKVTLIYTE